jgi:hypothetical protein
VQLSATGAHSEVSGVGHCCALVQVTGTTAAVPPPERIDHRSRTYRPPVTNVSTTGHERDGHRPRTGTPFVAGPASVAKPDHRGRIWLAPKGPRGHCSGRAPSKPSPVIRFWRETVVPSRISWGSPRTQPDLSRSGLLSLTFGGDAGHERGRTTRGSYGYPVRPGPPATAGGSMG